MSQGEPLPEDRARRLFQQLIVALDFCHRLGIANRDIKVRCLPFLLQGCFNPFPTGLYLHLGNSKAHCTRHRSAEGVPSRSVLQALTLLIVLMMQLDNLLLHKPANGGPPQLKLCDFGLSKDEVESATTSACGTPEYMAPEVRITLLYFRLLGSLPAFYSSALSVAHAWPLAEYICRPAFRGAAKKPLCARVFPFPDAEGRLLYLAQVLMGNDYQGTGVDVWSAGVTLYTLCAGQFPVSTSSPFNQFYCIILAASVLPCCYLSTSAAVDLPLSQLRSQTHPAANHC